MMGFFEFIGIMSCMILLIIVLISCLNYADGYNNKAKELDTKDDPYHYSKAVIVDSSKCGCGTKIDKVVHTGSIAYSWMERFKQLPDDKLCPICACMKTHYRDHNMYEGDNGELYKYDEV
jgi:hypothetical protein